ncbi:DUF6318 family protein [Gleimia sp. 6138-11-ORH1]|uniref:DUF6318 family protein n=1 Tax=Gleimia sp. 6138-11-ORH1 TaxID=2973937 RepID=UPI0021687771|nr:DUF6318 family protein [Gleimia sp. 6138-11-ORH1]MCS4484569.1 DUF6318 family protein [Gleimia sp. 6138-11-ORH1]
MKNKGLPLLAILSFALPLAACSNTPNSADTQLPASLSDAKKQQAEAQNSSNSQTGTTVTKDEDGSTTTTTRANLTPTDIPNVYKSDTKIPRPPLSAKYSNLKYPAEGYVKSLEGATEVAKYFEESLTIYTIASADVKLFNEVCDSNSEFCRQFAFITENQTADGSWFSDYTLNKIDYQPAKYTDDNQMDEVVIAFTAHRSEFEYFNGSELTLEVFPAATFKQELILKYVDGMWKVTGFETKKE